MKKVLLVNGGSGKFGENFRDFSKRNNIECVSIRTANSFITIDNDGCNFFHLGDRIDLKLFSYAFIRVKSIKAHMTALLSYLLKSYSIPFNDHSNIEHTQNDEKITQMVHFGRYGIPIPKSIIFSHDSYEKNKEKIQEYITYPCVLKTNGSKGNAVWKISNQEDLESKMAEITHELILVQEFIENSYDVRALIFEGTFLGAIKRFSQDGFYNNVAKGGHVEQTDLSDEEFEITKKAMDVLRLDFGGADFIRTDKGIIFFEINKGPQVYGLEEATGYNISEKILSIILDKYLR